MRKANRLSPPPQDPSPCLSPEYRGEEFTPLHGGQVKQIDRREIAGINPLPGHRFDLSERSSVRDGRESLATGTQRDGVAVWQRLRHKRFFITHAMQKDVAMTGLTAADSQPITIDMGRQVGHKTECIFAQLD